MELFDFFAQAVVDLASIFLSISNYLDNHFYAKYLLMVAILYFLLKNYVKIVVSKNSDELAVVIAVISSFLFYPWFSKISLNFIIFLAMIAWMVYKGEVLIGVLFLWAGANVAIWTKGIFLFLFVFYVILYMHVISNTFSLFKKAFITALSFFIFDLIAGWYSSGFISFEIVIKSLMFSAALGLASVLDIYLIRFINENVDEKVKNLNARIGELEKEKKKLEEMWDNKLKEAVSLEEKKEILELKNKMLAEKDAEITQLKLELSKLEEELRKKSSK